MSRFLALRREKKYTQIQIQMLTGIDQSDYSKIERGRNEPTYRQCKLLALLFGTSMDYLAGLTDVRDPYPRSEEADRIRF